MLWFVITSKRTLKIEAKRRIDAEKQAWKKLKRGEELLYINKEEVKFA